MLVHCSSCCRTDDGQSEEQQYSLEFRLSIQPQCQAHHQLSLWFSRELSVRGRRKQWTNLLFPNLAERVVL